ncbi:hypothetical protein CP8484711_0415B, partial [Chlamydia psittaci 84-8471/1]
CDLFN